MAEILEGLTTAEGVVRAFEGKITRDQLDNLIDGEIIKPMDFKGYKCFTVYHIIELDVWLTLQERDRTGEYAKVRKTIRPVPCPAPPRLAWVGDSLKWMSDEEFQELELPIRDCLRARAKDRMQRAGSEIIP